ncbi:GntR family transcriptional regulator [Fictibacillus sp. WQ 8-8]|uniref:GntR family transcriptional regulator n=1 Tax=Fictibacillus sp. WQ 8-8 TaxID=2938788 RepID=UPI00210AA7C3|nr:GntR family transcriptional regulator [Fictibacillus sp. WQ 8-8]MCQ6268384.1 GntR family transcriptional regulator [Fictibacillus sp. WQ 8-8]
MVENLRLENRDTLHQKVCSILRKAILQGEFKPGERLKQSDLADSIGVSRMPVREALRKLESEGLVVLEPHKGAIVKSIQVEDILEIYELRSQLEKMAVELSVEKLKDEDVEQLKNLVVKMESTNEVDEFVYTNIEFHQLLIKYCPWKRLLKFIETLWNGFPQDTPQILTGQIDKSNQEHRAILEAVLIKDNVKASKLVSNHIKRTGTMLVQKLQDGQADK